MLPDTFSQYCEMNNGTEKWPMAPLRTVPAMTHEECMKNERDFNSVYRNALDNPASDPDMANLLKVAGRCKWDITAIQTLYTSICARSSTPEKPGKGVCRAPQGIQSLPAEASAGNQSENGIGAGTADR